MREVIVCLFSYTYVVFFFQAEDGIRDLTVTGVQTCALPIYRGALDLAVAQKIVAVQLDFDAERHHADDRRGAARAQHLEGLLGGALGAERLEGDRKSTRLNSSHSQISYAVFCLKKKKLRDSHLMPASLYKKSRQEGGQNPNPLIVTSRGSVKTSRQTQNAVHF